ncbi:MAG TPA: efflux transporter periplasmic adaptor subunit [Cyanobacteria bacterium UBA8803]|nr:efflux transporter periplasmic adaptor subunit [Cyanobacteria bacterium UBA9273]HBL62064.1 efflux transporter periplasmic adaptor subunit [Cyanobacteria bacterium UBA8803]
MVQAASQCLHKNPLRHSLESKLRFSSFLLIGAVFLLAGCSLLPKTQADAQPSNPGLEQGKGSTAVDVAIAKTGMLREPLEYVGSTRPVREVSLRSQIEGRLLKLNVDVGDAVTAGQILAQLDDGLLLTAVSEAQAELAALESEVARARTQVGNAKAKAEQARLEFQQAQADAARFQSLWQSGAISQQQAELAQTAAATAQQNLNAALKQIRTEQQAVAAAEGRVTAQQATVAQNRERQSYALLASPINGVVLERVTEPGNLVTPGNEVLKLGDFSRVKVIVPVSELELANIRVGQSVRVRLDAFAKESFSGEVTRISPAADPVAKQVPIEVTISNPNNKIGSGLMARVSFPTSNPTRVLVPQTAIQAGRERRQSTDNQTESNSPPKSGTIFVVAAVGTETTVKARPVQLGDRANGQVEILSGLKPGERFITRSSSPLKDGDTVRLSILSK